MDVKQKLVFLFERGPMPESAKSQPSECKKSQSVKVIRDCFPDQKTQELMRDTPQGTSEWHAFRSKTWGGSGSSASSGWSHYTNNYIVWLMESGRLGTSIDLGSLKFFDAGHYYEDGTAKKYEVLMNAKCHDIGLLLHPCDPRFHISPDRLVEFIEPEHNSSNHNKYISNSIQQLLLEIKNPYYKLYMTKDGQRAVIPIDYVCQLHQQADLFQCDIDFCVELRCKPEDSDTPPIPDRNEAGEWTGRYLIGELLITRYVRSARGAARLLQFANKHAQHLKKDDHFIQYEEGMKEIQLRPKEKDEDFHLYYSFEGEEEISRMKANKRIDLEKKVFRLEPNEYQMNEQGLITLSLNDEHKDRNSTLIAVYPPAVLVKQALPDITILPLKHVRYYITPPKGRISCIDSSTKTYLGEISVEIDHFREQKPLRVSMETMDQGMNVAQELDKYPSSDPEITKSRVKNPIFMDSDKSVHESIWDFALANKERVERKQNENLQKKQKLQQT